MTGREINRIIIITDRFETSSGAATVNVTCRYKLHVGFPEWSKWCRIKTRIISSLCIWNLYFTTKTLFSICTQTLIFCKELSCWCWCYSNDATLLLGRSHHYKHSTIIITNWLTVTKYLFLKWQWIFYLLRRCFLHRQTFTGHYVHHGVGVLYVTRTTYPLGLCCSSY